MMRRASRNDAGEVEAISLLLNALLLFWLLFLPR